MFAMAWMLLVLCNLFILCTLQYIRAITAEEISPLHVKIKNVTVKPASLSITLYCNITEKMKNYTYFIDIINKQKEKIRLPLNTQNCSTEFFIHQHEGLTLHEGVSVKITANGTKTEHDTWTTFYPEGEKQTSAENVSCFAHVSAVNCSWNLSEKAPNDTIYSLWLYQELPTGEKCQDYTTNLTSRQMHCSFKPSNITFRKNAYLLVQGSSNTTTIQFNDQWIFLADKEILNPPRNIQVNASTDKVAIKWEKPETHEEVAAYCFSYEINLKGDKIQDKNISVNESSFYTFHEFTSSQPFELKIRAKRFHYCHETEWSAWSKTFKFDPPVSRKLTKVPQFVLLAISTVIIVSSLICVCHRFQLLKKVFPPVPAPIIKLQCLEQDELKELQEKLKSGYEKLPDNEEDFKICEIENC